MYREPITAWERSIGIGIPTSYDIAQNLFVSPKNLIVEGIADLAYLNLISEQLIGSGRTGLKNDITIVPVGGADKVAAFVFLLRGNEAF